MAYVVRTADQLAQLGTITQVLAKKEIIEKIKKNEYWINTDLQEYETIRKSLRDLIKFI